MWTVSFFTRKLLVLSLIHILRRLPWYLSNVKLLKQKGERFVSSTQIAKEINVDASQIAKDLSYGNISGRTRVGYEVDTLIAVLEDFLGFTNIHKAFLFGVGSLGGDVYKRQPQKCTGGISTFYSGNCYRNI